MTDNTVVRADELADGIEKEASIQRECGASLTFGWWFTFAQAEQVVAALRALPDSSGGEPGLTNTLLTISAVHWDALRAVIDWWDGLPSNLRQDIEGSGAEPAAIFKARNALPFAPASPPHQAEREVIEAHQLNQLELLVASGYDPEVGHPHCYKNFSHVKFTNEVIRALSPVTGPSRGSAE